MLSAEIFTQNAKCQADKKESWNNSELNGDWLYFTLWYSTC